MPENDVAERDAPQASGVSTAAVGSDRGQVPAASSTSSAGSAGPAHPDADPTSPVTRPIRAAAAWSWRFVIIVLAISVAAVALAQIKTVVVPVLVALLVSSLLSPLVNWLDRRGIPRTLATVGTLLATIVVIGGLLTLAGASIASGIRDLADTAWEGIQEFLGWLSTGPLQLSTEELNNYIAQIQDQLEANAQQIFSGALSVGTSVGHVVAGALIAIFCLFFFLKEGRVVWNWVVQLFPRATWERVDGAGQRGWVSLSVYARTQLLVAFIDGVGIGLGAWILGVPLALPLGVLVFVGSFIPIVGAIVTGSIAVAVAMVDQGPWIALAMLGVVLLVQQAESHLLQPILMSRALKLHPVAVLLGVTTGTIIGGVVGALFAVPVIAVGNTVVSFLAGRPEPAPFEPRLRRRKRRRNAEVQDPGTQSAPEGPPG